MVYVLHGVTYRSYKHPILEYIFQSKTNMAAVLPDEIIFTYEDIRQAMAALGMQRDKQASLSNFVIDLTRQAASHESRVPASIWEAGYDLDRVIEREVRQNIAGRLIRKELKSPDPWIVWQIDTLEQIVIPNGVPEEVRPYLGRDEGALLSVLDYCDTLSLALHKQKDTIKRVQHPKKWQPGEVDGLYFSNHEGNATLYPVEAKALSTGDSVNLAQIQGAYKTILKKITDVEIIPLAIQMIPSGMYIAVFEAEDREAARLIVTRSLQVTIEPVLEAWQKPLSKRKIVPR
jgi:hypothetical protein